MSVRQEIARDDRRNAQIGQGPANDAARKGQQPNGRHATALRRGRKSRQPRQFQILQHKNAPVIRLQLVNLFRKDLHPHLLAQELDRLQLLRGRPRRGLLRGRARVPRLALREALREAVPHGGAHALELGGGHLGRDGPRGLVVAARRCAAAGCRCRCRCCCRRCWLTALGGVHGNFS